jgi:hypothetical protein
MIPAGYMAKRVSSRPEWLKAERVVDIYSVSNCVLEDFDDYIDSWKHNGYWFFDSPEIIQEVAEERSVDLMGTRLFYYEVYELEFDGNEGLWKPFKPEPSFKTQVIIPSTKQLEGYDVVTFFVRTSAECSLLSCNSLAEEVETNQHCLLCSLEHAQDLLRQGQFKNTEPGPYRIFSVYSMEWP